MEINKNLFIELLGESFNCPNRIEIEHKCEKPATLDNCKKCWNEALKEVNNIELIGGTEGCQK